MGSRIDKRNVGDDLSVYARTLTLVMLTMEPLMSKSAISLATAVVVIVAALSLPAAAAETIDQPAKATVAAKKHPRRHVSQVAQQQKPAAWLPRGCTWPYTNQYPPCQSTWPAGDPNYHGSNHPGPTFDQPY